MKKVMSCPNSLLPKALDPDVVYVSQYTSGKSKGAGHMGLELPRSVRKFGLAPSVRSWDFATIAFSVAFADKTILRRESADGWTRMIDLSVCLNEPAVWDGQRSALESVLNYLTGDIWILHFLPGGEEPPKATNPSATDADCICLLSGGVDSLVGAIDLFSARRKPMFVSQVVRGDRSTQERFAAALEGKNRHAQWSFSIKHSGVSEASTRGRSIIFFAFAALATSAFLATQECPVEVSVPENGFISLNVPLGFGRLGSLSTKTTHPIYTNGIQKIWDDVGIHAKLSLPYRYKTKGELLVECAKQKTLVALIADSTSCGKFQRKLQQCGQCVPCMIRRAAFLKAGMADKTRMGYRCTKLALSEAKDVAAAATAYLRYQDKGVSRFVGGSLSFASPGDRNQYEGVVARGMDELGQLLKDHGVL